MQESNFGTVIRVYLVDGISDGLKSAEIMNWTGQVLVAPRTHISRIGERSEARKTGVYALVGRDSVDPSRDIVYIGESDDVFNRLTHHNRDDSKDFWEQVVLVTSKDENLTKTDVRYLESRLIEIASAARRSKLVNGTSPSTPPISDPDKAVMEDFLEKTQLAVSVMGFNFLKTLRLPPTEEFNDEASPVFKLTARGIEARALEVDGEFVVLAGSTARVDGTPTWRNNVALRDQLIVEGVLAPSPDPKFLLLTADTGFRSPSMAGSIFSAQQINGRTAWKLETSGETYAEWQDRKIANVRT